MNKIILTILVIVALNPVAAVTVQSEETVPKYLAESEGCFDVKAAPPHRINRSGYDFTAHSLAGADCIYYLFINSQDGVALFANWFFTIGNDNRELLYVRLPSCSSPDFLRPCQCTETSPCYFGQVKPRPIDLFVHGLADTAIEWSSRPHAGDYIDKPVTAYIGLLRGERTNQFFERDMNDVPGRDSDEEKAFRQEMRDATLIEKAGGFITSSSRTIGPVQIEFSSMVLPEEQDIIAYSVSNNSKDITFQIAAPEVARLAHNDGFVGLAWEPMSRRYGPEGKQVLKPFDRFEARVRVDEIEIGEASASIFLDGEEVATLTTAVHVTRHTP